MPEPGRRSARRAPSSPSPVRAAPKVARRKSAVRAGTEPKIGWSTSYHAESSSHGVMGTSDEESDEDWQEVRGRTRTFSSSTARGTGENGSLQPLPRPVVRRPSSPGASGSDSARLPTPRRTKFTRSRSPAVSAVEDNAARERLAAMIARHQSQKVSHWLPARWRAAVPVPRVGVLAFSVDAKAAAENAVLLISLAGMRRCLGNVIVDVHDVWIQHELALLFAISSIHLLLTHCSLTPFEEATTPSTAPPPNPRRQSSPDRQQPRKGSLSAPKDEFGYVWMTVPKNYRDSDADGIATVLTLPALLAGALLYASLRAATTVPEPPLLPPSWRIEPPLVLAGVPAREALVRARRALLSVATLCPALVLVHVWASWVYEWRKSRKAPGTAEGERASVPREEARRAKKYVFFALGVTAGALVLKAAFVVAGCGIWMGLGIVETGVAALAYQLALYAVIRLAHRGLTLGELGLVCFGGLAVVLEALHLSAARIWPHGADGVRTYRLPTPLLTLQIALVGGSLLCGILLAPLLVRARRLARMPARTLRAPAAKAREQRLLAGAFYAGAVLVVGGGVGTWTRWVLGGRDPWVWALRWVADGARAWTRPALLAWWAGLGSLSVAGWNRQLKRSRRFRPPAREVASPAPPGDAPPSTDASGASSPMLAMPTMPTMPAMPSLPAGELLDAAHERVPTLGLNARRKFFHALAVAMFAPGVAADPAFTHAALSAAFALFTFAEYVRYFALVPFGAAAHVFLAEFLDGKDQGAAVLSHFYLLTACAGPLWLEPPAGCGVLGYTGILAVGVGDAVASVVGKRMGRHRWSATTSKTMEGSAALVLAVVGGAGALRLCGLVEPFPVVRYAGAVGMAAALEALSGQNDNLTLPLYLWAVLVVAAV